MFARCNDLGISDQEYASLEEASPEGDLEKKFAPIFRQWDSRLAAIKEAADAGSARESLRYAEALIKRNLFTQKDIWDE
jgi:hypothetical protein